jgi:tetratricopeptide (TPR) repeat protein
VLSLAPAFLAVCLTSPSAPPGPAGPLETALALERQGQFKAALETLSAPLEPTEPTELGSAMAGRLLYERARITDDDLEDPLAARKLYGDYLAAFPKGPYAKLADDRRRFIETNGTPSPQALSEYEDVLKTFSHVSFEQSSARMAHIVAAYPAFPLRFRACFWLANLWRQHKNYDEASRWLRLIVHDYPDSPEAHRADLAIAQDDIAQDHFVLGIAEMRRYVDSPDPLAREIGRAQLGFAIEHRDWYYLFRGGLAAIALWLGALVLGIVRQRAPLFPLPFEVRIFVPVAVFIGVLAFYENRRVGVAVLIIAGGGGLLAALSGAYLRVASPRGVLRWLHLLAAAAAAASLAFCAVQALNLTQLVVDTIEQGADR